MDRILKQALAPERGPEARLNQSILRQAEEMTYMKKRGKRFPAVVLAACLTLAFCSITGFAAYKYFSPSQMAKEMNNDKLAEAFAGEDAVLVNETQEFGDFKITFLGIVAGKGITEYLTWDGQGNIEDDRLYIATAIERVDGTPMPATPDEDYGKDEFFVSPYVKGLNPAWYNIMTMSGGYTEMVQDGVMYRLSELNNIEMFADRGIYLGVSSGCFYDTNAYQFDEATGEITRNEAYDGINALFTVPVDKSKGDPAAAEAFLKQWEDDMNSPDEPLEQDETDLEVSAWMENIMAMDDAKTLTKDAMEQYAKAVESTVQVLKIDANGEVPYSYEVGDGGGGSGIGFIDTLFAENPALGALGILGYSYSENGLADLRIDTMTWNGDGTVTFAVYKPVQE